MSKTATESRYAHRNGKGHSAHTEMRPREGAASVVNQSLCDVKISKLHHGKDQMNLMATFSGVSDKRTHAYRGPAEVRVEYAS